LLNSQEKVGKGAGKGAGFILADYEQQEYDVTPTLGKCTWEKVPGLFLNGKINPVPFFSTEK
jgi:hypothetical protein